MKTSRVFLIAVLAVLSASCSTKNGDESPVREETSQTWSPEVMETPETSPQEGEGRAAEAPRDILPQEESRTDAVSARPDGKRKAGGPACAPHPTREYKRYRPHDDRPHYQWYGGAPDTESYNYLGENPFLRAAGNPLSTFSADVDTASYANVRRFINQGTLPPRDAVRIEELVNYFDYSYPEPGRGKPFHAAVEVARAPWAPEHKLVRVAIRARDAKRERRAASNLVFLLDVSGSMRAPSKLPLVKESMLTLLDMLGSRDRVAIVVYSGAAGLALESTPADRKARIRAAIERLEAGGSTAGGAGIDLAYSVARRNLIRGGINRVIMCTDGDFNVGVADEGTLSRIVEARAKSGVFLTVLGFGMGNYKDSMLEKLSNRGNGVFGYVDTVREARKHMVDQVQGTLVTVAKDVKIQVEFNPAKVAAYRLVGYENRMLHREDFSDDRKDAGDMGAGHRVTAFYEVVPRGGRIEAGEQRHGDWRTTDGEADADGERQEAGEMMFVKIRYKEPHGHRSRLLTFPVRDADRDFHSASREFRFAAAVAEFGLILRESEYRGRASLRQVRDIAAASIGSDARGLRRGFLKLVREAERLAARCEIGETTRRDWRSSF